MIEREGTLSRSERMQGGAGMIVPGRSMRGHWMTGGWHIGAGRLHIVCDTIESLAGGLLNGIEEHVTIEEEIKGTGSTVEKLAEHDILGDSAKMITLGERSGLKEDLGGLLEGAAHQGTGLDPIDAVARDGHQMSAIGHDVRENGEMTIVDVGAIEGDHFPKLL